MSQIRGCGVRHGSPQAVPRELMQRGATTEVHSSHWFITPTQLKTPAGATPPIFLHWYHQLVQLVASTTTRMQYWLQYWLQYSLQYWLQYSLQSVLAARVAGPRKGDRIDGVEVKEGEFRRGARTETKDRSVRRRQ